MTKLGITLEHVGPEGGAMVMPVQGNTQPAGILHGGATIALAETVASWAAREYAHATHGEQARAVGVSVQATHHRAAREGIVRAEASAQHLGSRMVSYLVEVMREDGVVISTVIVTCMILPG